MPPAPRRLTTRKREAMTVPGGKRPESGGRPASEAAGGIVGTASVGSADWAIARGGAKSSPQRVERAALVRGTWCPGAPRDPLAGELAQRHEQVEPRLAQAVLGQGQLELGV